MIDSLHHLRYLFRRPFEGWQDGVLNFLRHPIVFCPENIRMVASVGKQHDGLHKGHRPEIKNQPAKYKKISRIVPAQRPCIKYGVNLAGPRRQ